jgi:hypothetical protein
MEIAKVTLVVDFADGEQVDFELVKQKTTKNYVKYAMVVDTDGGPALSASAYVPKDK